MVAVVSGMMMVASDEEEDGDRGYDGDSDAGHKMVIKRRS